jgi:hypothetical protein
MLKIALFYANNISSDFGKFSAGYIQFVHGLLN